MTQELEHPLEGWLGKHGKQRNRRVVTLEHLREVKRWISWMVGRWEVETWAMKTREEMDADPKATGFRAWRRDRRQDEYPENRPQDWLELSRVMRAIASRATQVSLWAEEQERLTRERLKA